jgi:predicted acyl esterase
MEKIMSDMTNDMKTGTIPELGESYEVLFRKTQPVSASETYPGFNPSTHILPAGSVHREGGMPLPVDILFEQDVAVTLRDGTTIYVDVYRPTDQQDCPAIISWSPFGKKGSWLSLDRFENRMDVPTQWEDGLNKFEGPVPGYWVQYGYAIVNVDGRGVFKSEGDIPFFGLQDAEDETDVIAWIAEQPWSNGNVGACGNSGFAIYQWNICQYNPPQLKAIAPWEGIRDWYRDTIVRGGIPNQEFFNGMLANLYGDNYAEDIVAMVEPAPLFDAYWNTKVPDVSKSRIPAYIVASWTNVLHTQGTFSAWEDYGCAEKWLRVHNRHEWVDFFNPVNSDDLRRFFDYYLKEEDNGWKETPRVRLTVLDPGHEDILYRPETTFPLARQKFVPLYLDAAHGRLTAKCAKHCAAKEYMPDEEGTVFKYTFTEDTEIAGHIKLKAWMEAASFDDMDVFAFISKLDVNQNEVLPEPVTNRYHQGANGRLRASMRKLDTAKSRPEKPFHTFDTVEKLKPGEIVPLEIDIWPYAMKWHKGETLQLRINGVNLITQPEFPDLPPVGTINQGNHIIHTGGKFDSHLLIPVTQGVIK